ncbi:hypothetical protein NGM99_13870 [Mesorhizobium sp. RP14(2022)]|uniref:DUF982 domain-containing protein n=1 Tax=Mesorhizobium liriopis TaxID=2953882 RepID=A0ABT1C7Q1_9HYPH|nr:hypothetical protein [Mesorhizobium liriopis]MCO6050867.1 hypothetical protein [Mesorhizobium liriopis]
MNQTTAFTDTCVGGHRAFIRFPKDGKANPLLAKGGTPKIFPTEKEAWKALAKALCAHANGHLVRSGERAGKLKAEADKLFRGGGKIVRVEKRGRKRA